MVVNKQKMKHKSGCRQGALFIITVNCHPKIQWKNECMCNLLVITADVFVTLSENGVVFHATKVIGQAALVKCCFATFDCVCLNMVLYVVEIAVVSSG